MADLDDYRWLVGTDADRWFDVLDPGAPVTPALTAQLRRELSADRAHLLLEQVALRRRARAKFSHAAQMFFTPVGLEQATDETVANYKALRFTAGPLADLCCGVGGDLVAMATRGAATGVERDASTAILAEANVLRQRENGESCHYQTTIIQADASNFDVANFAAWHIDPDRRPSGRRTTRAELHEPGPACIDRLLAQCPRGAVKLSPAAVLPDGWARCAEQEWISHNGECRQLVLWFGALTDRTAMRRATVLGREHGESAVRTLIGGAAPAAPPSEDRIGRYLYEPDSAILAAGLAGVLAEEHGIAAITPGIAYLTGDAPISDPALLRFEIAEVMPFDLRRVRAWLRERGVGRLEIKKRGVPDDPAEVRRRLELHGDQSATLILTRFNGRVVAIFSC